MLKRVLTLVVVLCLALTALTAGAFADQSTRSIGPISEEDPYTYLATVTFENATGKEWAELYFTPCDCSTWGNNLLGDEPLGDGVRIIFHDALQYNTITSTYDLKIVTSAGQEIYFDSLSFSFVPDANYITLTFTTNSNGLCHLDIG